MTAWNDFVKKIYHEGHNKDSNYSFKQALKDASARKSEMGKTGSVSKTETAMGVTKSSKSSRKSRKSRKSAKKSKKTKTQRRRK
jgi:hypothetical protein